VVTVFSKKFGLFRFNLKFEFLEKGATIGCDWNELGELAVDVAHLVGVRIEAEECAFFDLQKNK
jgi:ferritin-like protein